MSSRAREDIVLSALDLQVGDSASGLLCPFCLGGRTGERKLGIRRTESGVLFNCLRASCGVSGFVPTAGALVSPDVARKPKEAKPYWGTFEPLQSQDVWYFRRRFGIDLSKSDLIGVNEHGHYVQRILDPRGLTRGYAVRRRGWTGYPDPPRTVAHDGPKTALYMNSPDMLPQSIYRYWSHASTTADPREHAWVLVEDCISAIKLQQNGWNAVALLGTHLNNDRVREIAMLKPSKLVIALDPDASAKGLAMARKYGLAFPKVRVVLLEEDLKDTNSNDFYSILETSHA